MGDKSFFQTIEISSKDDTEDFRAKVYCVDILNDSRWVLKARGNSPEEAAKDLVIAEEFIHLKRKR